MNKNEYIISALLVVFAFGFGLWIGYEFGFKTPYNPALEAAKESSNDTFEAGWRAAQLKVADSSAVINQPKVHALNGHVTDVGGGEFTMDTTYVSRNPLADPAPKSRIVEITKATKIYKKRKLTAAEFTEAQTEYREDMKKYRDAVVAGDSSVRPPRPVLTSENKQVDFSALEEGQRISVQNLEENIEYSNAFTAESVYIIE